MKILPSFALSIILFGAVNSLYAAEPWSLERCISYAIDNNIQVKQSESDVELSKLSLSQSKWDYSPSLSAGASYSANFGRSLDPTTYSFVDGTVNNVNGSISLSTQLFGGMRKLHTLKRAELNLLASIQDVEKIKNEVTISVAAAYLQILYNIEQITNSENQIVVLDEQIERTKKLVDAGSVALGTLLELQSQQATEQYNLVNYRGSYSMAVLNLTQLLEMRNAEDFLVEIPLTDNFQTTVLEKSTDDIFNIALRLPRIEADKLRVDAAERAIDIARARLYPTLDAGVQFGSSFSDARQKPMLDNNGEVFYSGYPFFDQIGDNATTAIQVSLNIPIFNGLTSRRNVSTAKVQHLQSRLALTLSENRLYKEIGQALTDASAALGRYNAANASVISAQQAFQYSASKFAVGAVNSVDYNTAKNTLINAQSMRTQAKYEYIFKIKILDFYQGVPIKL